jgi:glutamate synthase domain-containing protein 2
MNPNFLSIRICSWPTCITTQPPSRNKGIVLTEKAQRVANFQQETVKNLLELLGAAGLNNLEYLGPEHIIPIRINRHV